MRNAKSINTIDYLRPINDEKVHLINGEIHVQMALGRFLSTPDTDGRP